MASRIEPWRPPGTNEVEMAAVVALYRQGLAAQTPSEQKTAAAARAVLEEWFKVPKTAALIAKATGEKIDGLLAFRNEGAFVRVLYLAAREHRRGMGSQLLTVLKDLCAKKGVHELRAAYSARDERQRAFFAKNGFKAQAPAPAGDAVEATLAIA